MWSTSHTTVRWQVQTFSLIAPQIPPVLPMMCWLNTDPIKSACGVHELNDMKKMLNTHEISAYSYEREKSSWQELPAEVLTFSWEWCTYTSVWERVPLYCTWCVCIVWWVNRHTCIPILSHQKARHKKVCIVQCAAAWQHRGQEYIRF